MKPKLVLLTMAFAMINLSPLMAMIGSDEPAPNEGETHVTRCRLPMGREISRKIIPISETTDKVIVQVEEIRKKRTPFGFRKKTKHTYYTYTTHKQHK